MLEAYSITRWQRSRIAGTLWVLKPKHLEERGFITRFPHLSRFFSLKGFTGGRPVLPYNEASRMTPNGKLLIILPGGYAIILPVKRQHKPQKCDHSLYFWRF
jgi:hypothetical protein